MTVLEVENLHVGIDGKEILKGVNLKIRRGEIHSLMGPNGSGKSTLWLTIAGHPKCQITHGDVLLDGKSILEMTPDERAKKGLFLAFQHPAEIPGVSLSKFLFNAYAALHAGEKQAGFAKNFPLLLEENLNLVGLGAEFAKRAVNHGLSGGEKKLGEVLQLKVLKPKIAILDEIDSGLDIDALKRVASALRAQSSETGFLVVTHYQRILKHLEPQFVHVMVGGKIAKSGGRDLAFELEETGYGGMENGNWA